MKSWKTFLAAMLAAMVVFALAGCQNKQPQEESPEPEEQVVQDTAEPEVSTDPFYVLVMGLDSRDGTVESGASKSRSDTMMLVRVDPTTYQIGILSIPRDTYAWVGDTDNKINEAYYLDGPEAAIDQVELLTGVRADYYMSTTFVGFEDLVNALDGVDAYVPIDMSLQDIVGGGDVYLSAGEQHLDGAEALVLARVRKTYVWEGESNRQTNSRAMVENMIKKVAENPDSAKAYADALYKACDTDMPRTDFDAYVKMFCDNAGSIDFVDGTTPYANGMDDAIGLWIVYRDEDTSHACAQAVNEHSNPQEIVPLPAAY